MRKAIGFGKYKHKQHSFGRKPRQHHHHVFKIEKSNFVDSSGVYKLIKDAQEKPIGIDEKIEVKIGEVKIELIVEIDEDAVACIICFDLENEMEEPITLGCTHTFHAACIADWFKEMRQCPSCRANFYNGNYHDFQPEEVYNYNEDY